jgi:hypothetical protein
MMEKIMEQTQITTLKDWLKTGVVTVEFTKKDGTQRTMKCTLQESYLPKSEANTITKAQTVESPQSLSVWDVDANGWRAFRYDSVITWTV